VAVPEQPARHRIACVPVNRARQTEYTVFPCTPLSSYECHRYTQRKCKYLYVFRGVYVTIIL
jgi:hypothetical protein